MEIKKIKLGELKQINEFYRDYVETYKEQAMDCYKFVEENLEKCECCGKIVYWDEIQDRKIWNGKVLKCCEHCQEEIDAEEKENEELRQGEYETY